MRIYRIAVTALFTLFLLAGHSAAQEREIAFLNKDQAGKLFPAKLLEYKFKGVKIKDKSDDWKEYSSTYKTGGGGDKELKLVINDGLLKGSSHWKEQRDGSTEKSKGYPSKLHKTDAKSTVMVFVGERFRVDFKSTSISPGKLKAMAAAFDFGPIAALAPPASE
jgi:hypothetical protein